MKKFKCFLFLTISFLFFLVGNMSLSAQCNGAFDCVDTRDTGPNCPENSKYWVDYTFSCSDQILDVGFPFPSEISYSGGTARIKILKSSLLRMELSFFCEEVIRAEPLVIEVVIDREAPFGGYMRYYVFVHWSCADSFVTTGK
ncbi:hypothetical protein [Dysgonomonas mossii]|uniref:hypothetical protein n=1 Tax=Dysgonomonas mossii TaxID=163665 RepID=UPI0039940969